jgi:hypothetical protein
VFAVDGDTLYSAVDRKPKRSRTLRRIENARARPDVTILVDQYEEDWRSLWWIRLRGRARVLDECEERERALALLSEKVPAVPRAAHRRSGTCSGRDRSARMDKLKAGHWSAVIGRSLARPGLAGSADTSDALTAAEDENELERQGRRLPLLAGRPELPCGVDPPLRSVAPVGRASARVLPARARPYSGRQRSPCGVPRLGSACETPERCRIAGLPYVCAPIAGAIRRSP